MADTLPREEEPPEENPPWNPYPQKKIALNRVGDTTCARRDAAQLLRSIEQPECNSEPEPEVEAQIRPPWEDPSQPFFRRFFQTFYSCCFEPSKFFGALGTNGSPPWGYAIIGGLLAGLSKFILNLIIAIVAFNAALGVTGGGSSTDPADLENALRPSLKAAGYILTPLVVVTVIVFSGLLYHGVLYVLKGTRAPLLASFRVLCYAQGSAAAWRLIPCLGPLVYLFMWPLLSAIGLQKTHKCAWWKVIIAVGIPMLVVVAIAGFVVIVAFIQGFQEGRAAAGR